MMTTCANICHKYAARGLLKPYTTHGGPYEQGFSRCDHCDIYLNWKGKYCPCCNNKVHFRPAYARYKKLPERLYIE